MAKMYKYSAKGKKSGGSYDKANMSGGKAAWDAARDDDKNASADTGPNRGCRAVRLASARRNQATRTGSDSTFDQSAGNES